MPWDDAATNLAFYRQTRPWPWGDRLPVKRFVTRDDGRRDLEFGVLRRHAGGTLVLVVEGAEGRCYASAEAILDDGWVVD